MRPLKSACAPIHGSPGPALKARSSTRRAPSSPPPVMKRSSGMAAAICWMA
jgi:hypothetical protein